MAAAHHILSLSGILCGPEEGRSGVPGAAEGPAPPQGPLVPLLRQEDSHSGRLKTPGFLKFLPRDLEQGPSQSSCRCPPVEGGAAFPGWWKVVR